jgi:hypothetical protein
MQKTDDVVHINIFLMLHCVALGTDGEQKKLEIKSGGSIFFLVDLDDNGSFDTNSVAPIWFCFSLNVDIYAFLSWGRCRDDTELATFNSLRLLAFLHRLEHEIPGEFIYVNAPDYPNMLGRYGFSAANEFEKS